MMRRVRCALTQLARAGGRYARPASRLPPPPPTHTHTQGHVEVVWVLLRHGFSVGDIDECGNTALHLASAGGFTEIVKSLLSSGVVLGVANWYGNTALDLATNAETRSLLSRLTEQLRCAATNVGAWHGRWKGCITGLPTTHLLPPTRPPTPTPTPWCACFRCCCVLALPAGCRALTCARRVVAHAPAVAIPPRSAMDVVCPPPPHPFACVDDPALSHNSVWSR
jgi:hypothetical protein